MAFVASVASMAAAKGKAAGSGHCVALVQSLLPAIGNTSMWKPGTELTRKAGVNPTIPSGTAIATFVNQKYENTTGGRSHAAIFLRFSNSGIVVFDQWKGQVAAERTIEYRGGDDCKPSNPNDNRFCRWSNDADRFYIIEH